MSTDTLTLTVDNGNSPVQVVLGFTGTVAYNLTCLISINGGATGPAVPMTSVFCTIPASPNPATIVLTGVAGTGAITSFKVSNGSEYITKVATSNSNTWGLSTSNISSIASFNQAFFNADKLLSVPNQIPSSVTDLSQMFANSNIFNGITNTNGTDTGTLSVWNTGNVTNMSQMFTFCLLFNSNIGTWNTTNVVNMGSMFSGATLFNADISNWSVNNVVDMSNMFAGNNPAFNKNITYWEVRNSTAFTNMFADPGAFKTAFFGRTGYDGFNGSTTTTPTDIFFNQPRPERFPCFMKGSQILCLRAEEEVYRPVQDLRKGDLVKTYRNGYLPIHMIGTSRLSNPGDEERISNRLYKCSKDLYPDLFEDLYITGCHSILVPALTNDQWENTKDLLGNVYITDNHFRLMACVDEKAQPFKKDAMIDIYHIALENEDYYMNYGIYANGLLVESCSKRYLTELSNMRIIGEDEACYDAPSVNVFSELGAFVQTF
jgi:hypothetical protein